MCVCVEGGGGCSYNCVSYSRIILYSEMSLSENQVSLMLGSLDAVTKALLFNKEAYLDVENHSKYITTHFVVEGHILYRNLFVGWLLNVPATS